MTYWEYEAWQCNDVSELVNMLNSKGQLGWEVVTVDFFIGKNEEGTSINKARIVAKRQTIAPVPSAPAIEI